MSKKKKNGSRALGVQGKPYSDEKVCEALTLWVEEGSVTTAARRAQVSNSALSSWTKDPERQAMIRDIRNQHARKIAEQQEANAGKFAKCVRVGIERALEALENPNLEYRDLARLLNAAIRGMEASDRIVARNRIMGELDAGPLSDLSDDQLKVALAEALSNPKLMASFEVTKKVVLDLLGEQEKPEKWR